MYVCMYIHAALLILGNKFVHLDADQVKSQARLCEVVLNRLKELIDRDTVIRDEVWTSVLRFLLSVADSQLSPPAEKGILWF